MSETPSDSVVIEVPVPDPTPDPEPEPVVVVVESDPEPEITPTDLDHESRLTALELLVAGLAGTVDTVAEAVIDAEQTADTALDIALTTPSEPMFDVAPEPEPSTEDTVVPNGKHWWWKSWSELMGKS